MCGDKFTPEKSGNTFSFHAAQKKMHSNENKKCIDTKIQIRITNQNIWISLCVVHKSLQYYILIERIKMI